MLWFQGQICFDQNNKLTLLLLPTSETQKTSQNECNLLLKKQNCANTEIKIALKLQKEPSGDSHRGSRRMQKELKGAQQLLSQMPFSKALIYSGVRIKITFLTWQRRITARHTTSSWTRLHQRAIPCYSAGAGTNSNACISWRSQMLLSHLNAAQTGHGVLCRAARVLSSMCTALSSPNTGL